MYRFNQWKITNQVDSKLDLDLHCKKNYDIYLALQSMIHQIDYTRVRVPLSE